MDEPTVNALEKPGEDKKDTPTPLLREGARRKVAQAIEAEVEAFAAAPEHLGVKAGRRVVIRNGRPPERAIQGGTGRIAVDPETRDGTGMARPFDISFNLAPRHSPWRDLSRDTRGAISSAARRRTLGRSHRRAPALAS